MKIDNDVHEGDVGRKTQKDIFIKNVKTLLVAERTLLNIRYYNE